MDELTAMQTFRAERDAEPAAAREAIRRALEARMDAAAAEARAFGEAVAGSSSSGGSASRRRGLLSGHRRLLAFAAAACAAGVVAGALVLSSGPSAQTASAAEILHRAAMAATAHAPADAPTTMLPGPGQYIFRKGQRLDVEGWRHPVPPFGANVPVGGTGGTMNGPHAYNALVSKTIEEWLGPEGQGRYREALGAIRFWSSEEEERWKAAGSPLPPPFDPEYRQLYRGAFEDANEASSHVIDMDRRGWGNFNFPDTSKLPTEPQALRQAVENNEIEVKGFNLMFPKERRLDAEQTMEELINCLSEAPPTPALQAAAFNALAELPNIRLDTEATDGLGRHGSAIVLRPKEGVRTEYLFDPETGAGLAQRTTLVDPAAVNRGLRGIPAGTVIAESDAIATAIVDSTQETGQGVEHETSGGGAAPVYRR
jgi:hypothetical protein